jgi:hypothetical protein
MSNKVNVPSFNVYKIDVYPQNNNAFRVDREESWILKNDKSFTTLDEAKDYIVEKSLIHTELSRLLVDIQDEHIREEFIQKFCFGTSYLAYQRFFIDKPDIRAIQKAIEDNGVRFIKEK